MNAFLENIPWPKRSNRAQKNAHSSINNHHSTMPQRHINLNKSLRTQNLWCRHNPTTLWRPIQGWTQILDKGVISFTFTQWRWQQLNLKRKKHEVLSNKSLAKIQKLSGMVSRGWILKEKNLSAQLKLLLIITSIWRNKSKVKGHHDSPQKVIILPEDLK